MAILREGFLSRFLGVGLRSCIVAACLGLLAPLFAADTPTPISLDTNETLFAVLTAMNSCGYDVDLNASDAQRLNIRAEVQRNLKFLEEAARRDHRKIGADLDLFSFPSEIGSGLAVFHPKGGAIRTVMEDYSRKRHQESGEQFVNTPHITKSDLYEISGHLGWFKDDMFPPMHMEGAEYYLKPMNCPMHILVFRCGCSSSGLSTAMRSPASSRAGPGCAGSLKPTRTSSARRSSSPVSCGTC